MLNKRLKELLEFVRTTDLQEVVWEKNGTHISFRRTPAPAARPAAAVQASNGTSDSAGAPAPEPLTIRSTMVGTFYRADSPDRPPLVLEGTLVKSGQIVATVEAMKIMKDVVSPHDCRIVKALVTNGHPVEYGQPLFEVELVKENV
jgi:acetyl-CoA carboxylase biotin carboxyl carrier protein